MVESLGQRIIFQSLNILYNLTIPRSSKKKPLTILRLQRGAYFIQNEDSGPNLILLDAHKERLEFPELKKVAYDQWKYWNPDTVIIEAKASGLPLNL